MLRAVLTHGWPPAAKGWSPALGLFEGEEGSSTVTLAQRLRALADDEGRARIGGGDTLVRRRVGGFARLTALIAAAGPSGVELTVAVDAFAWAFLRGIENVDLNLPARDCNELDEAQLWRAQSTRVRSDRAAYARLEDHGQTSALSRDAVTLDEHRRLRQILLRPNARDELRVLALLLMSGPSQPEQLADELRVSEASCQRLLGPFHGGGERSVLQLHGGTWRIRRGAIPWVLFVLERCLGIELLTLLEDV